MNDRQILTLMAFVGCWVVGHVFAGRLALLAAGGTFDANTSSTLSIVIASAMFGGPVLGIVAAISTCCLVGIYNRRQS